jgi:hypothetical protein
MVNADVLPASARLQAPPAGIAPGPDTYLTPEVAMAFDSFLGAHGDAPEPDQVMSWVRDHAGVSVAEVISTPRWAEIKANVQAAILAALNPPDAWNATTTARARIYGLRLLRLMVLLEHLTAPDAPTNGEEIRWILRSAAVVLPRQRAPLDRLLRPPSIGELKVVRIGPSRYVAGAIARIENVMASEHLSRDHRSLHQIESVVQTTEERVKETLQEQVTNTQSALRQAVSSTVSQSTDLEAGMQVSAAYGPAVKVNLDTRAAVHGSRQDASEASAEYSTQITRKAQEKILERTQEVRTLRETFETEDKDLHEFDNRGKDEHIRGVYRWVDSVQDCWIESYGIRLMIDMLVPEPAAVLRWAEKQEEARAEKVPAEPQAPQLNGQPLAPEQITVGNYQQLAGEWNATNVPDPQPEHVSMGLTWRGESAKVDTYVFADSATLSVPKGYEAHDWVAHAVFWGSGSPDGEVVMLGIGSGGLRQNPAGPLMWDPSGSFEPPVPGGSTIPVVLLGRGLLQVGLEIMVTCNLAATAVKSWQGQVYDRLMAAYTRRHDAWLVERARIEDAAFQMRALNGLDENPAAARDAERIELRRAVIELLLGYPEYGGVFKDKAVGPVPDDPNAVPPVVGANLPPMIFSDVVAKERDTLTFFEQAFDWRNMSWVLYPYYWQDSSAWATSAEASPGPDPLRTAFMTSGAARVVVPARSGFENAVNFFLATGIIWNGGDVPTVDDSSYLAIQDEIADALGTGQVPLERRDLEPIRLPTTLVWLQPDGSID